MERTLFVTDMDGTLLGADSLVSPRSAAIINELTARGALITVATARTPATVQPLLADTAISVPAIVMTGATLWDTRTQTYDHPHLLPVDCQPLARQIFERHGIHPFIYNLSPHLDATPRLHVYHRQAELTPAEQKFVSQRDHLPLKCMHIGHDAPVHHDGRRMLYFAIADPASIDAAAADFARLLPQLTVSCYADPCYPGQKLLEINGPGVSKAQAVNYLRQRCEADRVVVYGDNLNDLPMMAVADLAVATGNAVDAVKDAAHLVIGPNTDDAVARHMASLCK